MRTTQHVVNNDLNKEILQLWQEVSQATLLKIVSCLCLLSVVSSDNIRHMRTVMLEICFERQERQQKNEFFLRLKKRQTVCCLTLFCNYATEKDVKILAQFT